MQELTVIYRHRDFGKSYERFAFFFIFHKRKRQHFRVDSAVFAFMAKLGEILAVLNNDICVFTTPLMMFDIEVVPLKFPTPKVENRAFFSAQTSSYALGFQNREIFCYGIVGLEGKVVRTSCMLQNIIDCLLRCGCPLLKRHYSYSRKVV